MIITIAHAGMVADATSASDVVVNVLNFMLTISGTIGIIAILVLGIIYLISRGDAGMTENAKHGLTVAVIGLLMIFGALVIVRTIAGLVSGTSS